MAAIWRIVGASQAWDGTRPDPHTLRLFLEGVPTAVTSSQISIMQAVGGENDGLSRQLGRFVQEVAPFELTNMTPGRLPLPRSDRAASAAPSRQYADGGCVAVLAQTTLAQQGPQVALASMGDLVLLELVLAALLVLLVAIGLFLWTRLAATSRRTVDAAVGKLEEAFWGGVMSRYLLTSGLLVKLELFEWGVRLRGIPISRWIVPTWEAKYEELAIAELVALPTSRIAVCFRLRGGDPSTIAFLSDYSSAILPALQRHGVPVNRSVTQIRRIRELYE
jgi:hypothetical protein